MTATSISSPRTARVRARPSAPSCRRRTGRRWRRPRGPPASTKGSESRSQEIHHGPAGEADKTEQHHKRISINITRLQSHREPRAPLDERRGAIGTEAVDGAFIPALPEKADRKSPRLNSSH